VAMFLAYFSLKNNADIELYAAHNFLVQAANATDDPLAWLINLGVAGIVIILFVTGKLRSEKEVLYLLEQIEAKDQVISAFQAQLTGHALPALAQSAQALEQIPRRGGDLIGEVEQARADLTELTKAIRDLTRGET